MVERRVLSSGALSWCSGLAGTLCMFLSAPVVLVIKECFVGGVVRVDRVAGVVLVGWVSG